MSLPRRLGRLFGRGFASGVSDERFQETLRSTRERGENLKDAFETARKTAAEEWRAAEKERIARERAARKQAASERASGGRRRNPRAVARKRYPAEVIAAYDRLGLLVGVGLEGIRRKRRELVKRHHPDRFADPDQRRQAELLTAEINAAHDTIERFLLRN